MDCLGSARGWCDNALTGIGSEASRRSCRLVGFADQWMYIVGRLRRLKRVVQTAPGEYIYKWPVDRVLDAVPIADSMLRSHSMTGVVI